MSKLNIVITAIILGGFCFSSHAEEKFVRPAKIVGAGDGGESSYQHPSDKAKASTIVPPAELYPEGALMNAYQEELFEANKAVEMERNAAKVRDDYEKKKVEAEREIAAKKFQIEGFKMKQEQAASDMDAMNTELTSLDKQYKDTETELQTIEQKAQEHFAMTDEAKKNLENTRKNLEDSLDKLKIVRETTAKNINKNYVDIQRMRAEVAVLEAEVENVEFQKATLQAEEMKTRTDWVTLKKQIEDKNADKARSLAALSDTKKKFEQAQKDHKTAKFELDTAEKSRAETEARVNAEIRKLDESTYAAQRSKAMNMAEKIRIEAEVEKLKAYVAMVKKSNKEAIEAMKDTQSEVMESRLALETAKSELTREVASGEKENFKKDKLGARLRGLASVAESSDIMEGAKTWVTSKSCQIRRRPASNSEVLGEVVAGQKLVGATASGPWVKIMNSSGAPAYVKSDCGKFD